MVATPKLFGTSFTEDEFSTDHGVVGVDGSDDDVNDGSNWERQMKLHSLVYCSPLLLGPAPNRSCGLGILVLWYTYTGLVHSFHTYL